MIAKFYRVIKNANRVKCTKTTLPRSKEVEMKAIGATLAALLIVIVLCVGGWFGYWWLAKANQSQRYDVNTHSQQYLASLISQERDRVAAYDSLPDGPQRTAIARMFCAVFQELSDKGTPPSDLTTASIRLCPAS